MHMGLGLQGVVPTSTYTTGDDINPALPSGPKAMGIIRYSLLWVMPLKPKT